MNAISENVKSSQIFKRIISVPSFRIFSVVVSFSIFSRRFFVKAASGWYFG